jgi:hypothetical protein
LHSCRLLRIQLQFLPDLLLARLWACEQINLSIEKVMLLLVERACRLGAKCLQ